MWVTLTVPWWFQLAINPIQVPQLKYYGSYLNTHPFNLREFKVQITLSTHVQPHHCDSNPKMFFRQSHQNQMGKLGTSLLFLGFFFSSDWKPTFSWARDRWRNMKCSLVVCSTLVPLDLMSSGTKYCLFVFSFNLFYFILFFVEYG